MVCYGEASSTLLGETDRITRGPILYSTYWEKCQQVPFLICSASLRSAKTVVEFTRTCNETMLPGDRGQVVVVDITLKFKNFSRLKNQRRKREGEREQEGKRKRGRKRDNQRVRIKQLQLRLH